MRLQDLERRRSYGARRTFVLFGQLRDEMLSQKRQVVFALTKRRQLNRDDVEAIEQVFTERAIRDGLLRILVRGREQTHINRNLLRAAETPHRALFKHAQKFSLQKRRHLCDLVEQERAAVGY